MSLIMPVFGLHFLREIHAFLTGELGEFFIRLAVILHEHFAVALHVGVAAMVLRGLAHLHFHHAALRGLLDEVGVATRKLSVLAGVVVVPIAIGCGLRRTIGVYRGIDGDFFIIGLDSQACAQKHGHTKTVNCALFVSNSFHHFLS
jgi:hypothetical protein